MSYCCEYCFFDSYLHQVIKKAGEYREKCDFCGQAYGIGILPQKLEEHLEPLVTLYKPVIEYLPAEMLRSWDGDFIWDILAEQWNIFSDDICVLEKQKDLFAAIFQDQNDFLDRYLSSWVGLELEFFGVHYQVSSDLSQLWDVFKDEITFKNRFLLEDSKIIGLKESLEKSLSFLSNRIRKYSEFQRGRIGLMSGEPEGWLCNPPVEKAIAGRANPIGISYLYVATTDETVIGELRPNVGDKITVGDFESLEEQEIVDLTFDKSFLELGFEIRDYFLALGFLSTLSDELSKPILPKDEQLSYLPTQYLCEFIKNIGFDGVRFVSRRGPGDNLVFFYPEKFKLVQTRVVEILGVEYSFQYESDTK